ncbi:phosphate signaling complex protein PhoU [Faucicola atlantae]|uniref:phosphate signaling complex protein PhoU n=1 Tax=Faucicola atlantae TaxID=34059 RepID=UPI0025B16C3A|nr:phosphate signaling complex protein PhoU [Moraxella atlantae]
MRLIGEHISKQFDQDLQNLLTLFLRMGGMAEQNLINALQALSTHNRELAESVVKSDRVLNANEKQLDEDVVTILARRQPVATDLRLIMALSKASTDIERIGDEAKRVAKLARHSYQSEQTPIGYPEAEVMGKFVQTMLKHALEAFATFEVDHAYQVVEQAQQIDSLYKSASRALMTYVMEDPRQVSQVVDGLWVLRALERSAAHALNVAEQLIFCITGEDVRYPKSTPDMVTLGGDAQDITAASTDSDHDA